jgi:ribokinase
VLNAAPSCELPDELWDQVDVLAVNEHEAADLVTGLADKLTPGVGWPILAAAAAGAVTPEGLADALLGRVPAVVVTLGGKGSLVARRGVPPVRVPAAQVTAVDTTGAGDTYCGVLAAALAGGAGLADAARLAGAAGALAVTRPGAQDSVPAAADVVALARAVPAGAVPAEKEAP